MKREAYYGKIGEQRCLHGCEGLRNDAVIFIRESDKMKRKMETKKKAEFCRNCAGVTIFCKQGGMWIATFSLDAG